MSAHRVYLMVNYDGDPYAIAHTEAERDRLLDLDDGSDSSWSEIWCYEHHVDLAALPLSIVVDGKVVETYAVLGVMNRERKLEVSMMELLDAAREVAK